MPAISSGSAGRPSCEPAATASRLRNRIRWALTDLRSDELLRGGLVPVASGMDKHEGASAIRIKNRYAALHVARMKPAETVVVPDAPYTHLFLARGTVDLEGAGTIAEGDAVRLTGSGGQTLTAVDDAEVLIWEMHARAD